MRRIFPRRGLPPLLGCDLDAPVRRTLRLRSPTAPSAATRPVRWTGARPRPVGTRSSRAVTEDACARRRGVDSAGARPGPRAPALRRPSRPRRQLRSCSIFEMTARGAVAGTAVPDGTGSGGGRLGAATRRHHRAQATATPRGRRRVDPPPATPTRAAGARGGARRRPAPTPTPCSPWAATPDVRQTSARPRKGPCAASRRRPQRRFPAPPRARAGDGLATWAHLRRPGPLDPSPLRRAAASPAGATGAMGA